MKAKIIVNRDYTIGEINPMIYGSFVEHMGRCVYNGIYEPTHPTADEYGFRGDVKEIIREMNVPVLRYPGGNFLSGYRWEDGVGPRENRPRKLDPAWQQLEPNEVGTDEFHRWAKEVGSEVMMAVNLGTRGPEEAAQLLEYCNMPAGSHYADLRAANGCPEPYGDRVWCLGNEMDGEWQIGCRTAEDYADIARKTAALMKKIDPGVKLVACGSSNLDMPTFGYWEQTVLETAYDQIDYISLHQYFPNDRSDRPEYLANALAMDGFIRDVVSICDATRARLRRKRRIDLSFDEWNVWPQVGKCDNNADPWTIGPRREEFIHTLEDTLLISSMMMTFIRHCDRVKMACMAQLVNVGAPVMTVVGGPVWKQPSYYPFKYMSKYGRGTAMDARVICGGYATRRFDSVPWVDAAVVWNEEAQEIVVFAVNRSQTETAEVTFDLNGFGGAAPVEHMVLEHEDAYAFNSAEEPDKVVPHTDGKTAVENGVVTSALPPYSWNMIRLRAE